jgi:DNA-binding transcriptional regulator YiaG
LKKIPIAVIKVIVRMTRDNSKGKMDREMNDCYIARMTLGRHVSQEHFAKLQGRKKGIIYRRESGESGITGHARNLYTFIQELGSAGFERDLLPALEGVAEEQRSEGAARDSLILLCIEKGRPDLFSKYLGRKVIGEVLEVSNDGDKRNEASGMLSVLNNMCESLEKSAAKEPDEDVARRLRSAAEKIAASVYQLQRVAKARKTESAGEIPPIDE